VALRPRLEPSATLFNRKLCVFLKLWNLGIWGDFKAVPHVGSKAQSPKSDYYNAADDGAMSSSYHIVAIVAICHPPAPTLAKPYVKRRYIGPLQGLKTQTDKGCVSYPSAFVIFKGANVIFLQSAA